MKTPRSQVVWVGTLLLAGAIALTTLASPLQSTACGVHRTTSIGAGGRHRSSGVQLCEVVQHMSEHPLTMLLAGLVFVGGGAIGWTLLPGDERAFRAERAARRSRRRNDPYTGGGSRPAGAATTAATPDPSSLPAFLRPSVAELQLAATILDETGFTWWLDVPPTEGTSRVRIAWEGTLPMRVLIGQQGTWTADLGIHTEGFEAVAIIPSPRACICVMPAAVIDIPAPVTVEVDLPGEVVGARDITAA